MTFLSGLFGSGGTLSKLPIIGGIFGSGADPKPTTIQQPFVSGGIKAGSGINPVYLLIAFVLLLLTIIIGIFFGGKR